MSPKQEKELNTKLKCNCGATWGLIFIDGENRYICGGCLLAERDCLLIRVKEDKMVDIQSPKSGVEIIIRSDGTVLWVNVDGECRLRICKISTASPLIIVDERRLKKD